MSHQQVESDSDETTCCFPSCHAKNKTNEPVQQKMIEASSNYRNSPGIADESMNTSFLQRLDSCDSGLVTCKTEHNDEVKEMFISRLKIRPKLAEKLKDIYDKEWKDALDELDNDNERVGIEILLNLLKITYEESLNHVHKLSDFVQDWLKDNEKCEDSQILDNFIESAASSMISEIEAKINKEVVEKYGQDVATVCTQYLHSAITICFYLALMSPEIYLEFECPQLVNKSNFKPYTRDGKALDYIVWPALFQDGRLIASGIVQCRRKVLKS